MTDLFVHAPLLLYFEYSHRNQQEYGNQQKQQTADPEKKKRLFSDLLCNILYPKQRIKNLLRILESLKDTPQKFQEELQQTVFSYQKVLQIFWLQRAFEFNVEGTTVTKHSAFRHAIRHFTNALVKKSDQQSVLPTEKWRSHILLTNSLISQELLIVLTSLPMQTEDIVGKATCSLSPCMVCRTDATLSMAACTPQDREDLSQDHRHRHTFNGPKDHVFFFPETVHSRLAQGCTHTSQEK